MATPTYISLFSGAGGGDLASQWLKGWRCVCYVERDPYAVAVLKARIRDGLLDDAPIWDDVSTFDGTAWAGLVDGITAGFPCQPFSVAGKRKAADDERNGWPATIRIIRDVRPDWCFLENVPGLLSATISHCECGNLDWWYDSEWGAFYCPFCQLPMVKTAENAIRYFGVILADLAESGFSARWRVLSAAEVGAAHKRDRLWIVAHTKERGRGQTGQLLRSGEARSLSEQRSHSGLGGTSALASSLAHAKINTARGLSQRTEAQESRLGVSGQMGHTTNEGLAERQSQRGNASEEFAAAVRTGWTPGEWRAIEPGMGGTFNGLALWLDESGTNGER